jgi:O-antigen/teichoic acid export membrane protein
MLQSTFSVLAFMMALNSGVFYYYYEYEKMRYRKLIFTSWFYYQIAVALVLFALLFIFRGSIAELFIVTDSNLWELETGLILIGVQFFPYIFNITNINLFRIDRKPRLVMYITLLEAAFTLLFVWGGITYFDFGIVEIVASQIAARAVVALLFIKSAGLYLRIWNFSSKMLQRLLAFSWPFFIISAFSWAIISLDKFIGADLLTNTDDVALLALAMQLSLPIAVLADMIRMAIGPFVMSIRKEEDADKSYQQVFDLSVFSGLGVLISLIVFSPLLIYVLADHTFLEVLKVLPLIALASVISLIANQFAISFSLQKKNVYILYATVLGGIIGFVINYVFMPESGFIVAGISQIISYLVMAIFLFVIGKRITDLRLNLKLSLIMLTIISAYIVYLFFVMETTLEQNYLPMIGGGIAVGVALIIIYFKSQNLNFKSLINGVLKKK